MTEYEKFLEEEKSAMVELMDALIRAGYTEEEAGHMLAAAIDEHDTLKEINETLHEIYANKKYRANY